MDGEFTQMCVVLGCVCVWCDKVSVAGRLWSPRRPGWTGRIEPPRDRWDQLKGRFNRLAADIRRIVPYRPR